MRLFYHEDALVVISWQGGIESLGYRLELDFKGPGARLAKFLQAELAEPSMMTVKT